MKTGKPGITLLDVTPDTVEEAGIYCIRDKKSPGWQAKVSWFRQKINAGLRIRIAVDSSGKQLGFIEYMPGEQAWRPVQAEGYYFVQCIVIFSKEARQKQIGSVLLESCEQEAKKKGKRGVCAVCSDGAWMANRSLFEKNGFKVSQQLDRFDLLVKNFDREGHGPVLIDWRKQQQRYKGWHLVYADQCPWHAKSVADLSEAAAEMGIQLQVKKLNSPAEAQKAPSGFGTFSLLKDGELLGDHYLSRKRFENIVKSIARR